MPKAPVNKPDLYTRDLNSDTWPDFEKFFAKNNGVQAGCWCMYYHRSGPTPGRTLEERLDNNHGEKEKLVKSHRSRGILVYHDNEVIGSCQYGSKDELPRIDYGRIYPKLSLPPISGKPWRITCFFVDKQYRRQGVAKVALNAVLSKIKDLGGGMVEAYPVTNFKAVAVWFGTVEMFSEVGFRIISDLGNSNVVMRKEI